MLLRKMSPKQLVKVGIVDRYHTEGFPVRQSIAHHSWNAIQLYRCLCPNPSPAVILYLLDHDMPEKVTGDVPATAKWEHGGLADALNKAEVYLEDKWGIDHYLTPEERRWAKAMDLLELVLWCDHLVTHCGILGADAIMQRGLEALNDEYTPKEVLEWMAESE